MLEENTPIRLTNAYLLSEETEKVVCAIDKEVYDYFFRHVIAGYRGGATSIISQFFQAFYSHCLKTEQIPECWDASNPSRLASILQRINFNDTVELINTITRLESELADARGTNGGRRANSGAAVTRPKPAATKRKPGTTRGNRAQSTDNGSDTGTTKAAVTK